MRKLNTLLLPFFTLFFFTANAQIAGIINRYAAVTAIDSCTGKISVTDTSGFQAGQSALLIQMQGADMQTGNNANFGAISAMNSAGYYERVRIEAVSAGAIFVKNRFVHAYNPAGKVQLVSLPQFTNVVVTDTLRAKAWDGTSGGVLALEVSGTLSLNAPIQASGVGFRGGANYLAPTNGCNWATPINGYVYALGNWRGAYKGEGIASGSTGQELGRGPQANGGGGGNDHNAGGGGGSNTTDGGDGGNNADPNPIGCNGYFPGLGGYAPSNTANRLFLGGGGGAGHANNLLKSKGGNGGGIVFLNAGAINGATPAIYAKGTDAGNSFDDGAGGGGAGGSIWLSLTTPSPNLVLNANGGRGGSADNNNVDRCMGPGGGGGGGRIQTNAMPGLFSIVGGAAGITYNSTVGCNNSSNSAQAGALGEIQPLAALPTGIVEGFVPNLLVNPQTQNICLGQNAVFSVEANAGDWLYQWQVNAGSAWQDITGSSSYSGFLTNELTVINPSQAYEGLMFRCRVFRAGCSEAISTPAVIHLLPAPTAGFSASTNLATANFNNLSANASTYFWTFGDGSQSTLPNPSHSYAAEGTYNVTLYAISACDTAIFMQTVTIVLLPTAAFTAPATTFGCGSAQVNFSNQSSANATAYAWSFPGGTPNSSSLQNPSITYSVSGTYTARLIVSNSAGKDTLDKAFDVEIFDLPSANFNVQILAGGLVKFTNLSQNGESFTWDYGDGSPQQSGFDQEHTYQSSGTYVVTLIVNSPCGASIVQQEVVIQLVGTQQAPALGRLRLYPVPAGQWCVLDWSETADQAQRVQIFDAMGRRVYLLEGPTGQRLELPLEGFPDGVYQVAVWFGASGMVSRALVKG